MAAQVAVFLLSMQAVIHAKAAFLATLPVFIVGVAGGYWFWWRNLPPAAAEPAVSVASRRPDGRS
jgi:hypothetical protein